MQNLLDIENLSVSLDERVVLNQVSVHLKRGEMIGLIGPNGAGKSTLIKTILQFLKTKEGRIALDSQDIQSVPQPERAKKVAYLPQDAACHWPLEVHRVVELGRLPHLLPWQKLDEKDEAIIHRSMEDADILSLQNRPVDHLAGGEQRLVMLARVLAVQAELILADEPVAGLDPNHQLQVMDLLKNLAHQNRGVLIVLHDLTLAARFCDRLILLREGKVLASGSPSEVLTQKNIQAGYGIEVYSGRKGDDFYVIPWSRI